MRQQTGTKASCKGRLAKATKVWLLISLARSSSYIKIIAADIPQDRYKLTLPVLVVATLQDAIYLPGLARRAAAALCTNATVHDIDTGHWAMLEKPDEINALIDGFLTGL
jgi:pimeloyl-ACP methyl ester carboxylesterase